MKLKFTDGHRPSDSRSKLKPPPNYSSRRVQLRLMVLVSMFMLVIVLMEKARDPKLYEWMWSEQTEQQTELEDGKRPAGDEVDTSLPPQREQQDRFPDALQLGSERQQERAEGLAEADGPIRGDALRRTRWDGWLQVWQQLQSQQQSMLNSVLRATRSGRPLSASEKRLWQDLLSQLEDHWKAYFESLEEAIAQDHAQLSEADRQGWQLVVQQLKDDWNADTRPSLRAVLLDRPLSKNELDALASVQADLDRLALQRVRDDTMGLRAPERAAWFRLLEMLADADGKQLQDASLGPVSYLQLFHQPRDYRGKLVTIRGTARMGYRVQAPANELGIDEYHVFWVKPAGGPNSPFVVYALQSPAGLPDLKHRDKDRTTTALNDDVQITGYFFKRWGYLATDQPRRAPLLLAKMPQLEGRDAAQRRSSTPFPSYGMMAVAVLGLAALGIVVALVVYRTTSAPSGYPGRSTRAEGAQLNMLTKQDISDIPQALRKLADHEQQQMSDRS